MSVAATKGDLRGSSGNKYSTDFCYTPPFVLTLLLPTVGKQAECTSHERQEPEKKHEQGRRASR